MNNKENIDQELVDAINQRYSSPKENLKLGKELIKKGEKENNDKLVAYGNYLVGFSNQLSHHTDNVFNNLILAFDYFSENQHEVGYPLTANALANYYDAFGDYEKAMEIANKGLISAKKNNYKEYEADLLSTLGILHSRTSDTIKALDFHKKALEIREELNLEYAKASSLNLIARTNVLLKNYEAAEKFYKDNIVFRESINDVSGLLWTYIGLASMKEEIGERDEAKSLFLKANEINKDIKETRAKFQVYKGLSRIYCELNNAELAFQHAKDLLSIAEKLHSKPLEFQAHQVLSIYYEKQKNIEKAFQHYKKYIEIKEQVINSETQNKIAQQKAEFDIISAKQEAEIYQLKNVELKKAFEEIEEKNKEITASINYAKHIQEAILPRQSFIEKNLPNSFILFKPKDIVSGDFYWFAKKGEKVFFSAVDCTGHGVPGAMLSMIGSNFLNQAVNEKGLNKPNEVLSFLDGAINDSLHQTKNESGIKDGMDLAVCAIDFSKNILEYAGAYNPLYLISNYELIEVKGDKFPIGANEDGKVDEYTLHSFELKKGDAVYIFSDGFADQFGGEKLKKFKYKQLKEVLLKVHELPVSKQKDILDETFENWKGGYEQIDDVILIGVKIE